jgi:hypothetical protein
MAAHFPTMLASKFKKPVAARPRETRDETCSDRIGDCYEHDRDRAALALHRGGGKRPMHEDHIRLQGDQLFRGRR